MQKSELRRKLIQSRQTMSQKEWREKSDRLCTHLQSSTVFTQAKTILAYLSHRQEPDLSPLFQHPQRWGIPRCVEKSLIWHAWKPSEPLQKVTFGIFEPHPDLPTLQPKDVDLILVPAVACDTQGYRLGYGGGYYDRMLCLPEWSKKPTIGIIFEFAVLPQLPIDHWDQPLHAICTETGFRQIESDQGH